MQQHAAQHHSGGAQQQLNALQRATVLMLPDEVEAPFGLLTRAWIEKRQQQLYGPAAAVFAIGLYEFEMVPWKPNPQRGDSRETEYEGVRQTWGCTLHPYIATLERRGFARWTQRFTTARTAALARATEMQRVGLLGAFMRKERRSFICDGSPHSAGCNKGGAEKLCPRLLSLPKAAQARAYETIFNFRWRYYKGRVGDYALWRELAALNPRAPHFVFDSWPDWRRFLWSQMEGLPPYPLVGRLFDPHGGREIFAMPKQLLDVPLARRLVAITTDRRCNRSGHRPLNRDGVWGLAMTCIIFNVTVHGEKSIHETYRAVCGWLACEGDSRCSWVPFGERRPAPLDSKTRKGVAEGVLAYAVDCYARHCDCGTACPACGGTIQQFMCEVTARVAGRT
jgi:hypothetical protein